MHAKIDQLYTTENELKARMIITAWWIVHKASTTHLNESVR